MDYVNTGKQAWKHIDMGHETAFKSITGGIFEFGFSDAFQQMIGAFVRELSADHRVHPFGNVLPEETAWSHQLFTAALESNQTGKRIDL